MLNKLYEKQVVPPVDQVSQKKLVPRLSLRTNFSWAFVGNGFYAACQWGMLILLAKIGSPAMVGQFSLGLAITAPVFMFANLNLRAVQVTDSRNQYTFGDYLGLKIITMALAFMAVIGIVVLGGYELKTSLVILAVGLAKYIESISSPFYGLLQRHGRMDYISKSMIIKGVVSLILLSAIIYRTGSVVLGALGLAFAWAAVLATYDIFRSALIMRSQSPQHESSAAVYKKLLPTWHWKTLFNLTWLALPLGFVMMFQSLSVNIPRILVERYLGEHYLGIFSAIAYIQVVGTTIVGALGESASPRLADHYAAGDTRGFVTLLLKLLGVGLLLGAGGLVVTLLAGGQILTLLYRSEYVEYDLFVRLMLAAGLMYLDSFLGYGITAARYFRIQTIISLLYTGATAALCFWLIPAYGMRGAANAIIIAACLKVATYLAISWYVIKASQRKQMLELSE